MEREKSFEVGGKTVDQIIYPEPNGNDIMEVFLWFKEIGFGKNWVLGNDESLFAERLTALSRGESIDFLIWNCIGFKWFQDKKGGFPSCEINNNLDASIVLYFQERIKETYEMLSLIGNPKITILVPSNEAFDETLWLYKQPYGERNRIINETVFGIRQGLQGLSLPDNSILEVQRWDDFLKFRDATKTADQYSSEGKRRVKQAKKFDRIKKDAMKSGKDYYAQNGITNIKLNVLEEKQLNYYGVYAGEGVFYEEMQNKGNGIVVVNFEEMRVSQMASLGANGNLSIVTPITENQMVNYYRWRKDIIRNRSKQ